MTGYGGNYTIPAGYHNGSGIIKSVVKIPQVTSLAATAGNTTIAVSWKNPSKDFTGIMIRYKAGSYPTSVTDGAQAYNGTANSCVIANLANGTAYYVRAFTYLTFGGKTEYNTTTSGTQAVAAPYLPKGQQVFTSSGSFTIPAGITSIEVFCVGGGAAGGTGVRRSRKDGDDYLYYGASGSGGGSGYTATGKFTVMPGSTYGVMVGAGGKPSSIPDNGQHGGTSSFGSLLSAAGGKNIQIAMDTHRNTTISNAADGGAGGSGGGAAGDFQSALASRNPGAGGANGKDGGDSQYSKGGSGQGTTTRAFKESGGTLYAGSGGGGVDQATAGIGGDGGGGSGGRQAAGKDGTANTGGGGGGGATVWYTNSIIGDYYSGGQGGSGVVIVRWGY